MKNIDVVSLLIYLLGYVLAVWMGSGLVGRLVKPFNVDEIPKGFTGAGRVIGQLERFLIFTALILDSYVLIGIVLTLKAIYRFSDITGDPSTKMKISEYFIIGTFSSIAWTFIVFFLCELLLKNLIGL